MKSLICTAENPTQLKGKNGMYLPFVLLNKLKNRNHKELGQSLQAVCKKKKDK